jgi:hypothetical protein
LRHFVFELSRRQRLKIDALLNLQRQGPNGCAGNGARYTVDYHDEPESAPFIVAAIALMDGLVDMSSYWVFSDVFEEGGVLPGPYHGGFGLMNIYGIPKPAYRAFELLHGAGATRHHVDGTCPCGVEGIPVNAICSCAPTGHNNQTDDSEVPQTPARASSSSATASAVSRCVDASNNTASGVLATSNGTHVRLFLYNHPLYHGVPGSDCTISITLDGNESSQHNKLTLEKATVARIDGMHANPKAAYLKMGSPPYPSAQQLTELRGASELVWEPLLQEHVTSAAAGGDVGVGQDGGGASTFALVVPASGLAVVDVPLPTS